MKRKAKIVSTIGPSSGSKEILQKLIQTGIDVARLNFSHGTHESHGILIDLINELSNETKKPITLLQDLQGPKLRVGTLPDEGVRLIAGDEIILRIDTENRRIDFKDKGQRIIYLDVPQIFTSLIPGGNILLDDGKMEMVIIQIMGNSLTAKVTLGGVLFSNKGINLPGAQLDIPGFTDKDQKDLEFGLSKGIDAIALSFVRDKADILCVREFIQRKFPEKIRTPIIAKLELPEAIENLETILDVADGVMVARGDLAVETSPAEVPIIQKKIIQAANKKAKLVITATQMLDSMINNPRPTRAEASDVANAILDGTDAVMLSGETASGDYPVESVAMMDAIICEAEVHMADWGFPFRNDGDWIEDDAFALSLAACKLAHDREVVSVVVFTQSGKSAIYQSKARSDVPILAFTPNIQTYRSLNLYWGVKPFLAPFSSTIEDMLGYMEKIINMEYGFDKGQKVVFTSGFPIGKMRSTNLALLHTIGSLDNWNSAQT